MEFGVFAGLFYVYVFCILSCITCISEKRLVLHSDEDILQAVHVLSSKIQSLEAENKLIKDEQIQLKTAVQLLQTSTGSNGESNYVRWGHNSCPGNGTSMLYTGYAAGSHYTHTGGAANYLCLPHEPEWAYYEESVDAGGRIYGAEYEAVNFRHGDDSHYFGHIVQNEDVPCAVCVTKRPMIVMIPGRLTCYSGWTKEYSGYLMSGYHIHASATEYVCVDANADVIDGGHQDENGRLFYLVDAVCGSLKCPPYANGRELTCVVCSK